MVFWGNFDGIWWYLMVVCVLLMVGGAYRHQSAPNSINYRELPSKPINKCPTCDLFGGLRGSQLISYFKYWWVLVVNCRSWWKLMRFDGFKRLLQSARRKQPSNTIKTHQTPSITTNYLRGPSVIALRGICMKYAGICIVSYFKYWWVLMVIGGDWR